MVNSCERFETFASWPSRGHSTVYCVQKKVLLPKPILVLRKRAKIMDDKESPPLEGGQSDLEEVNSHNKKYPS